MQVKILGLKQFEKKLNAHERKLGQGVGKGLKNAGKHLLNESNEIVPTDDEDLLNSGAVRSQGSGFGTVVSVGYSETYAVEVHEDLESKARHGEAYNIYHAADIARGAKYFYKGRFKTYHKRRPQEQAKFLETALRSNLDEITGIVRHGVFAAIRT